MSYFVYILQSQQNGDIYIGSTSKAVNRLRLHNSGRVKSTKGCRPWTWLEKRACNTRGEAISLGRFLKTGQQKEILRRKYK